MVKRTANSLAGQLVKPGSGSAILLDGTILNQGDLDSTGGEGGIRTPGRGFSPYNGLANRRIQPLCHLSADGPAKESAEWAEYNIKQRRKEGICFWPEMQPSSPTILPFSASKRMGRLSASVPPLRDEDSFLSGVLNIEWHMGPATHPSGMRLMPMDFSSSKPPV